MTAPTQTSELAAPVETAAQLVPALRTAAAAGLVAFGLSFPIISYHAEFEHQQRTRSERALAALVRHRGARLRIRFPAPDGARRLANLVRPRRLGRRGGHGRGAGAGGAGGRGYGPAIGRAGGVRALFRPVHAWPRDLVPAYRPWPSRAGRLAEVDQQLRRPDFDLRDARLGIEHCGRPRRPSRSRLRGLLRRRRLFVCAALDHFRPFVLDLPAARRSARGDVGDHSRVSRAEAQGRLSGDRDAGVSAKSSVWC